jgi:glutaminyl-tRNA synthetase
MPDVRENLDFLREAVRRDTAAGRYGGRVVTRFPPEPNGFLHIGHAKSICINFGIAREFGGVCHLRFDDTNPETEDMRFVESIQRDVRWLGFDWDGKMFFASDYFERLHGFAVRLVEAGKAYVDSLDEAGIREYRGTVTAPGRESPWRNRSVAENLDLFARMRAGEFPDGAHVLRAKIDMAAANMKMRDPLLYRIRHATHYRTGDAWCIYPMYDFAHPLSDAIEGITHSICTLEFENNRAIYDWLLDALFPEPRPHQYEFARLNLDYAVMSKRKLAQLVEEKFVSGWDDPRMPTIAGLRRRGYTPEGIRLFASRIGVDKTNSRVGVEVLEDAIRDDLNARCPRAMAVLRPLPVTIADLPDGGVEWVDAPPWAGEGGGGAPRKLPLSREIVIERDDFAEIPPEGWLRLSPGAEVRLAGACLVRCDEVVKEPATGEVSALRCSRVPEGGAGGPGAAGGKKRKATAIHWLSASHAVPAEVRLYDRLCDVPDPESPEDGKTFKDHLNPGSAVVLRGSLVEPALAGTAPGERFQFVRNGYFVADEADSKPGAPVFNRIIGLRDGFKASRAGAAAPPPATRPKAAAKPSPPPAQGTLSEERAKARAAHPSLAARYERYVSSLGLSPELADVLTGEAAVADFFEAALSFHPDARSVANRIANDVLREAKGRPLGELPFGPAELAELAAMADRGAVTSPAARAIFSEMVSGGGRPAEIAARLGLDRAMSDAEVAAAIDSVLSKFPSQVAEYRAGKATLLGMFTGHAMRAVAGKADPQAVQRILRERLG